MPQSEKKIIRIIDANANRAREGLRVCEDILRFLYDNKTYATKLKHLRHDVTLAVSSLRIPSKDLLRERESARDVGRTLAVYKQKKQTVLDLWTANIKRATEAVRVLEEFSKLQSKKTAADFQKIRFTLYQVEKRVGMNVL